MKGSECVYSFLLLNANLFLKNKQTKIKKERKKETNKQTKNQRDKMVLQKRLILELKELTRIKEGKGIMSIICISYFTKSYRWL